MRTHRVQAKALAGGTALLPPYSRLVHFDSDGISEPVLQEEAEAALTVDGYAPADPPEEPLPYPAELIPAPAPDPEALRFAVGTVQEARYALSGLRDYFNRTGGDLVDPDLGFMLDNAIGDLGHQIDMREQAQAPDPANVFPDEPAAEGEPGTGDESAGPIAADTAGFVPTPEAPQEGAPEGATPPASLAEGLALLNASGASQAATEAPQAAPASNTDPSQEAPRRGRNAGRRGR